MRDAVVTVTHNMFRNVWTEFKYCPDTFRATRPALIKVYLTVRNCASNI
jgi:hypothetical protein